MSAVRAVLHGDWKRLGLTLSASAVLFPRVMTRALHAEGKFYRDKIRAGIESQRPGDTQLKPISPVTKAIRLLRGTSESRALIESRGLLKAVVWHEVKDRGATGVFVGVTNRKTSQSGVPYSRIADIQEHGVAITSTISRAKLARLIGAAAKAGHLDLTDDSPRLSVINIPPRPFLQPVFDKYSGRRGAERMMARVARGMGGMLGVVNHRDLGGIPVSQLPIRGVAAFATVTGRSQQGGVARTAGRVVGATVARAMRVSARPKGGPASNTKLSKTAPAGGRVWTRRAKKSVSRRAGASGSTRSPTRKTSRTSHTKQKQRQMAGAARDTRRAKRDAAKEAAREARRIEKADARRIRNEERAAARQAKADARLQRIEAAKMERFKRSLLRSFEKELKAEERAMMRRAKQATRIPKPPRGDDD